MNARELQTTAAHVLHVERIVDADPYELGSRFGYHPLDLEAIQQSPVESTFSTYGRYGFLTLLWPDARHHDLVEVRCFIQPRSLTILGDTSDSLIKKLLDTVAPHADQDTDGPAELLHRVLQELLTIATPHHADVVGAQRCLSASLALRQCARWLQDQQLPGVALFIMDAHRLDLLGDQYRSAPTQPATVPVLAPRVMRAYAAAALLMMLAVGATLSLR